MKAECTNCHGSKEYRASNARNMDRGVVFVDESGRRWNGGACPDCTHKRPCRGCGKELPPARYYYCAKCQPTLPSDETEYGYIA